MCVSNHLKITQYFTKETKCKFVKNCVIFRDERKRDPSSMYCQGTMNSCPQLL